jgi:hypothetical protein
MRPCRRCVRQHASCCFTEGFPAGDGSDSGAAMVIGSARPDTKCEQALWEKSDVLGHEVLEWMKPPGRLSESTVILG